MTVDRDGHPWVAIVGADQVRRYSPDGALLARREAEGKGLEAGLHRLGAEAGFIFAAVRQDDVRSLVVSAAL
jgi:hypothetical protein